MKPCIKYGSCPFDELDSSKEADDSFCGAYGYECPSYSFTMKIRGEEEHESEEGNTLISKGDDLLIQMDNGIEEIEKCTSAWEQYKRAIREELESGTVEYGTVLYKQGITSLILANNGVDAKNNYLNAIELCRRARSEGLVDGTRRYAETLTDEARAHYLLVEYEEDARVSYEIAVGLFQQARMHGFKDRTHEYASTMVDEADALLQLSRLDKEPEEKLGKIKVLLSDAQKSGLFLYSPHNMISKSILNHIEEEI